MNEAVAAPTYVLADGDIARDRDAVLGVWRGVLASQAHMAAKWNWFYRGAPHGPPLLQLLLDATGECVGACTVGRRRMTQGGRELAAGLVVDLAVAEGHRSLGPALALQQRLVERSRGQLRLLLGFPNARAVPLFRRAGHRQLTELVRYVRVLNHGPYLRRRMRPGPATVLGAIADLAHALRDRWRGLAGGALHAEWSDTADTRMDALWARSRPAAMLATVRDASFVRWRFDASPLVATRHLLVSRQPGGPLLAWFTVERRGGVLHVLDVWASGMEQGMPVACIDALLRMARASGCSAVSVELATSPARLGPWLARGFVERGRRPLFHRWNHDDGDIGDAGFLFTAADEDE